MIRSYLHLHALPGRRDELLRRLDLVELLAGRGGQPGYLGTEIQLPFDDEDGVLVWTSWASKEHCDRWLGGADRAELLDGAAELLDAPPELHVYRVVDALE
jgi:heme-degrading monooxygenase HmoA